MLTRAREFAVVCAALAMALGPVGALARPVVVEESSSVVPNGAERSTAQTVWFQGFLADDATGDPINASYNIIARIYNAAGGGTLLWGPETHAAVTITEGWFNIELGSIVSPLPSFASPPYYLLLQVNGEYLTPRLKLASVPSALQAAKSDLLPFDGTYSGGTADAFNVYADGVGSGDGVYVWRANGADAAFAVYAGTTSPEAVFRGFQANSSSSDAGILLGEINNAGNDSRAIECTTVGAGPVYYGLTRGLYGVEVYADAADASPDSVAHVIHAVYDGGNRSTYNVAVYGESVGTDVWGVGGEFVGSGMGVVGRAEPEPTGGLYCYGVAGYATEPNNGYNMGIYGTAGNAATNNYAGFFNGDVSVQGTLTKSAGSFRIDHPLDPANKYLSHSFVESPDMKNIYDGVVVLDGSGRAVVELPEWFEALNRDFRYQLTCIGAFAPVYVAEKISGNRFTIAGGEPGMEVSWLVTGIRHDPYAEAHRIPVEEAKPSREVGKYSNPELYGAPASAGVWHDVNAAAERLAGTARGSGDTRARRTAPEGVDPAQQP
jgi:hypothetical protein